MCINSYWGISNYRGHELKVEKRQMECMSERPTDYWPYGWEYLKPYENWDMSTITAMVNGKYADMIAECGNDTGRDFPDRTSLTLNVVYKAR